MNKSQIKSITKTIQKLINDYCYLKIIGMRLYKITFDYTKCDSSFQDPWFKMQLFTKENHKFLNEVLTWKYTAYNPDFNKDFIYDEGFNDVRINDLCSQLTIKYNNPYIISFNVLKTLKSFKYYYKTLFNDAATMHKTLIKYLPLKSIKRNYGQTIALTWISVIKWSSKSYRKSYGNVDGNYECEVTKYRSMADIIVREIMCLKNLKAKAAVKN